MYKTLIIEISIILKLLLANTIPENKTYTALVKEKGEIYKEINEAIQESIAVLKKNNDTESVLGIEYMNQLKEQLKEINGNEITDLNNANNNTRRRNKIALNMAEISAFLNSKADNKVPEKKKITDTNKISVQKELDMWIIQQKLEKDKKTKKKRMMLAHQESCPRWGFRNKKKKVVSRRQDGGPTADKIPYSSEMESVERSTKKSRAPLRYPCCRKCCKKSYMGCL